MNFCKTACCAIQEISGLRIDPTPKAAMISFCRQTILQPVRFGSNTAPVGTMYNFYLFTAAVKHDGSALSGYYDDGRLYGKEFADFITEEKLGTVMASPVVKNTAFHSDHSNQVWVWTPDVAAVKEWWKKNKPAEVVTAKPAPKPEPKFYYCDYCDDEFEDPDFECGCEGALELLGIHDDDDEEMEDDD